MNVNINNKKFIFAKFANKQILLSEKFFTTSRLGLRPQILGVNIEITIITIIKMVYLFLSKEQADRCINGKDWKKIVSVSDKVKSDLEKGCKAGFYQQQWCIYTRRKQET